MKQALLTEKDIKNFIDESINGKRALNTEDLMSYFGVTRPVIWEYVNRGMPYILKGKKKYYIIAKVKKWIRENIVGGKIE